MAAIDWKLFTALTKNISSATMNRDLIGFELEATTQPVLVQEVIDFAIATNEDSSVYEEKKITPPLFISKLIFPLLKKVTCHKSLRMNILRMVHAEQQIIWRKPIRVHDQLSLKVKIKDIHDTPVGEMIEIAANGYREQELVFESTSGLIVRSMSQPAQKKSEAEAELHQAFRIEIATNEGQQLHYARASGDHNFIHTNNFLARLAGLPRTIMHGACVLAMSCSAIIKQVFDNDLQRLSSVRGRFGKPAIPGEKLILIGYEAALPEEIPFAVFNESGQAVFKNGLLKARIPNPII